MHSLQALVGFFVPGQLAYRAQMEVDVSVFLKVVVDLTVPVSCFTVPICLSSLSPLSLFLSLSLPFSLSSYLKPDGAQQSQQYRSALPI